MVNCSQGLVLATTAMVVSITVIALAYSWQKSNQEQEFFPWDQPPKRSCLCSSDNGKRRVKRQKKKRVRFAEDVKEQPTRRISRSNDVINGWMFQPQTAVALVVFDNSCRGLESSH